MSSYLTPNQLVLALSPEHIGWDGLCGLIERNWPQHMDLIDTAMEETDRKIRAAGGDPEDASALPPYYATATDALRGMLKIALGLL
jgi:hypothetical protein